MPSPRRAGCPARPPRRTMSPCLISTQPGHAFGRIHRDDIARAVLAAMGQADCLPAGARVLNLSDDLPAESALVIAEAATLLGLPAPPAVPFAEAEAAMSPMARSFWAE